MKLLLNRDQIGTALTIGFLLGFISAYANVSINACCVLTTISFLFGAYVVLKWVKPEINKGDN